MTSEDLFRKIYTSHFIVSVRKGLLKVCVWERVGDQTELQYFDPDSYGRQRCVFLVLHGCSTGGPEAHSSGFFYHTSSLTPTVWLLSWLSYIIVQSPTQSLEWHVWSSSSGNNCHAVQKSFSSLLWVYHGIFLPCPISLAKPVYAISSHNCHWNVSLPSGASPWNGKFGRVEGQNTTHRDVGKDVTQFPGLLHFTLNPYIIMLSVKQGNTKSHFLNLWYGLTGDWTSVFRAFGEHSNR